MNKGYISNISDESEDSVYLGENIGEQVQVTEGLDALGDKKLLQFMCELCGNIYLYKKGLERHRELEHSDILKRLSSTKDPAEIARIIEYSRRTAGNYHNVVMANKNTIQNNTFILGKRNRPAANEPGEYPCPICKNVYRYARGLDRHMKQIHNKGDPPRKYRSRKKEGLTKLASLDFSSNPNKKEKGWSAWLKYETNESEETKLSNGAGQFYSCTICGNTYCYQRGLDRHRKSAHGLTTMHRAARLSQSINQALINQKGIRLVPGKGIDLKVEKWDNSTSLLKYDQSLDACYSKFLAENTQNPNPNEDFLKIDPSAPNAELLLAERMKEYHGVKALPEGEMSICGICGNTYQYRRGLDRHMKTSHSQAFIMNSSQLISENLHRINKMTFKCVDGQMIMEDDLGLKEEQVFEVKNRIREENEWVSRSRYG